MSSQPAAPAAPAARASGVAVVDSYVEAQPLIEGGVRAFARAAGQAEAAYAALAASAPAELRAFDAQHAAQVAALRPHLAGLEALDAVVAGLEAAAATLDQQTRQLEGAIGDVLS
jgi:hypothetical protein